MTFDGLTYDPELDGKRLRSQLDRVRALMSDGTWRTLAEIQSHVGGNEPAISARLRDLRKFKFGGFLVEKRRRGDADKGVWEYRLRLVAGEQQPKAERFGPKALKASLEVLRELYPKMDHRQRAVIGQLGRWLSANLGDMPDEG